MAARLIDNIRTGQSLLRDRMLSDIAIDRGIVTVSQVPKLLEVTAPGSLGETLVTEGHISAKQLEQLSGAPLIEYLGEHAFLTIPGEPAYFAGAADAADFINGDLTP